MTLSIWLLYVGTVLLMMSTPGPSHLLMLSTSATNGFTRSLATAIGDLTANTLQILLAGFGLAALLASFRYGFAVIKWAGVLYLIWIGVRMIMSSLTAKADTPAAPQKSLSQLYWRGFITSAANPKAVVFFAALFPQFISPERPVLPQILVLGVTYLVIDGLFLSMYGYGASWLAQRVHSAYRNWIDRFAGCSLIIAAVLLGLRRVSGV